MIMTVWHDIFPKGVPNKYMNKYGTDIKEFSNTERYLQTIVMSKTETEY